MTPFSAIADPTRRDILALLRNGERPAGDLVEALGLPQPNVSKHLKSLREAGLVRTRIDGPRRLYRLDPGTRNSLATSGRMLVAVDTVGAGLGEMVLITQGSSARLTPQTKTLPVDTVIIGILDTVHVAQTCVYNKEEKS